jgi:hypothetical protein
MKFFLLAGGTSIQLPCATSAAMPMLSPSALLPCGPQFAAPGSAQIAQMFNPELQFQIDFFNFLTCNYLLAYTAIHAYRR